ncbi:putative RNA-binding protein ARP1 [Bidens hawaiensis]|uniref:putative RNA-binding protein ARP1 n=1 Tax=Bidens hawaiensis TaxID=980011 RepID=UPI0040499AFB
MVDFFGFLIVGPNVIVGPRSAGAITPPPRHVQWYYPPTPTPASPYHHETSMPYYGYAPATYFPATDVTYNHKLGYTGRAYMSGGHYVMYPSQGAHTLMPMYPMYPYHHQSQAMGLPAQFLSAGPMTAAPAIYSKPTQIAPTPGTVG